MATQSKSETVAVGGHRVTLTNLGTVLYPATGTTKRNVLASYAEPADVFIPRATDRATTRERFVDGVGTPGSPGAVLFHKNLDDLIPALITRRSVGRSDHANSHPLVNGRATLIWLAQTASLELPVPQMRFDRTGVRQNPDRIVVEVDHSDLVASDMSRAVRAGRVLVDWSQSHGSKTAIAPYSLRRRERPTVAAPRTWRELISASQAQLEYREVLAGVARTGDPLAGVSAGQDDSRQPSAEPVCSYAASDAPPSDQKDSADDRLTRYRRLRETQKTPEPIPESHSPGSTSEMFLIQEQHVRRLPFDCRCEHDGVLASWAAPKGIPTGLKKNDLAVQTVDHPLEYRSFEITIPTGEYGGGLVTIWDEGEYGFEKWRNDTEVTVTLHGSRSEGLSGAPSPLDPHRRGRYVRTELADAPHEPRWGHVGRIRRCQ